MLCRVLAVALSGLLLTGCSLLGRKSSEKAESEPPIGNPHVLFTAPQPYASLLVEIDAVEGSVPTPEEVEAIRSFLAEHCRKPGGITVKVDSVIPKSVARGRSVMSLELEYMSGPPDPDTAYLYILCYSSRVVKDPKANPYFTTAPHPASIFVDRSYGWLIGLLGGRRTMNRLMLQHEVGHALGLARNPDHARNGHCTDDTCLMARSLWFNGRRFLTGRAPWMNPGLCGKCRADLAASREASAPDNQRFFGPYFVRSEQGYHVIALPDLIYVHVGDMADLDREALGKFRARLIAKNEIDTAETTTSGVDLEHVDELSRRLEADRFSWVRHLGENLRHERDKIRQTRLAELRDELAPTVEAEVQRNLVEEILASAAPVELAATEANRVFLSDAKWDDAKVGWAMVARNHFTLLGPDDRWKDYFFLRLGGMIFTKGLFAHSPSQYAYTLDGRWRTFRAQVGLQDGAHEQGSAVFVVRGDGRELYRSPVLRAGNRATVEVEVRGIAKLELLADGAEGHHHNSWAVWIEPELTR